MARALVIGVGQIGSELGPALVERGDDVVLADFRPPEETAGWDVLRAALGEDGVRKRWRRLDVLDTDALVGLLEELRPDVTYHMAALLSATGEKNPDLCWRMNVDSTRVVMSTLSRLGAGGPARKLIVPSSIAAARWAISCAIVFRVWRSVIPLRIWRCVLPRRGKGLLPRPW